MRLQKAYLNNEAKLFCKRRELAQHKNFRFLCEIRRFGTKVEWLGTAEEADRVLGGGRRRTIVTLSCKKWLNI